MCDEVSVMDMNNWKELALNRQAWNDPSEKTKAHKGCKANEEEEEGEEKENKEDSGIIYC